MVLLSEVEKSSEEIMEIMQSLSIVQVRFFFFKCNFIFLLPHLRKENRREAPGWRIQYRKEFARDMFNLLFMGISFLTLTLINHNSFFTFKSKVLNYV